MARGSPGSGNRPKFTNKLDFQPFQKAFVPTVPTYAGMFYELNYIFHAKNSNYIDGNPGKDTDMDPHWFGSLVPDPDPHRGIKKPYPQ